MCPRQSRPLGRNSIWKVVASTRPGWMSRSARTSARCCPSLVPGSAAAQRTTRERRLSESTVSTTVAEALRDGDGAAHAPADDRDGRRQIRVGRRQVKRSLELNFVSRQTTRRSDGLKGGGYRKPGSANRHLRYPSRRPYERRTETQVGAVSGAARTPARRTPWTVSVYLAGRGRWAAEHQPGSTRTETSA